MPTPLHRIRTALCLVLLAVALLPAEGTVHQYIEDFTTTAYCDTSATDADWNTVAGEVRLFPFELTPAGSCDTPGACYDVHVTGDLAYVANYNSGLRVIDVSDPTDPTEIGSCYTPGRAYDVTVAGDYAYVAAGSGGLHVVDISDPTDPGVVTSYGASDEARGVAVSGNYAYVADRASGLLVIDITNPLVPAFAGTCATTWAYDIAIADDYAYVADHNFDVVVIDISDPTNPTRAGEYGVSGAAQDIAVAGDYAYVAYASSGLRILDISDPTNPSLAATYVTPGSAYAVAIDGDFAYVADHSEGLCVIDISDPTNPTSPGNLVTPSQAFAVAVAGEHAFVGTNSSGLRVISVCEKAGPVHVSGYSGHGGAYEAAVEGDHAYMVTHHQGFRVLDISDPANPTSVGYCSEPDEGHGVVVDGNYAYVANRSAGFHVVDISDPTNPASAGACDTPGSATGLTFDGDHAFVADGTSGLQVIDVSDPANPWVVGSHDTPGQAQGVAVAGDYAYLADGPSGIQVIDIGNPAVPTSAGAFATPVGAFDVVVQGDHAYVADLFSLEVIDISDPTAPVSAGSVSLPEGAVDLAVEGNYAFVTVYSSGLHVIDVSDPTDPFSVGVYDGLESAYRVVVDGDYAYVADSSWGLRVILAFQRSFDSANRRASSLSLPPIDNWIVAGRLNTAQTDSIRWNLAPTRHALRFDTPPPLWFDIPPDGAWHRFPIWCYDLRWRSTHYYAGGRVNPACTWLKLEWLYVSPIIESIVDVPDDQGGWAEISFQRSGLDFADEPEFPLSHYAIWERESTDDSPDGGGRDLPPGVWAAVDTVEAIYQETYVVQVPAEIDTLPSSVYCVTVHPIVPTDLESSPPDSGFSSDNLAPGAPQTLAALVVGDDVGLTWSPSGVNDEDLAFYNVYASDVSGFIPGGETFLDATTDSAFSHVDPGDGTWYYLVTGEDVHANEGEPSNEAFAEVGTGVVEPGLPTTFALRGNHPNPFNPRTIISFDLPRTVPVRLSVYSASGRGVATLVDGTLEAGRYQVPWNGRDDLGNTLGSGVYFARLEADGEALTRKMILVK